MADETLLSTEQEAEELAPIREEEVVLRAYTQVDPEHCGEVQKLEEQYAETTLETTPSMAVDKEGVVHGGFIFSGGNFAAMAAINNPYAILIAADVKFLAPIEVGNVVDYEAKVLQTEAKKREIRVIGTVMDIKVFEGVFHVAIFERHIFKLKLTK